MGTALKDLSAPSPPHFTDEKSNCLLSQQRKAHGTLCGAFAHSSCSILKLVKTRAPLTHTANSQKVLTSTARDTTKLELIMMRR